MNKKLLEVGTAFIALIVLAILFLIGASITGPDTAPYLYLVAILIFTAILIIMGRKVSEPVV
jgi:hypothetical protein